MDIFFQIYIENVGLSVQRSASYILSQNAVLCKHKCFQSWSSVAAARNCLDTRAQRPKLLWSRWRKQRNATNRWNEEVVFFGTGLLPSAWTVSKKMKKRWTVLTVARMHLQKNPVSMRCGRLQPSVLSLQLPVGKIILTKSFPFAWQAKILSRSGSFKWMRNKTAKD